MPDCRLNIEEKQDVTIVSFKDSSIMDTVTAQRLGRELYALVDEPRGQHLLIDFCNIRFLSSQTLGVLMTLRRKADKGKIDVVLAGLRPELARVFQVTNLDKMFRFFESKDAALKHFGVEPEEPATPSE
ncbi:MAG: STAS domain-containing protein [Planctomycetota bacterium]